MLLLVALCQPHSEREPPRPAELAELRLEALDRLAPVIHRVVGVVAGLDLFLRRAFGEEFDDATDRARVAGDVDELLVEEHGARDAGAVPAREREHVLLSRVRDAREPRAALRPLEELANHGLFALARVVVAVALLVEVRVVPVVPAARVEPGPFTLRAWVAGLLALSRRDDHECPIAARALPRRAPGHRRDARADEHARLAHDITRRDRHPSVVGEAAR